MKHTAFIVLSLLVLATSTRAVSLKVSVYYESLCPYSRRFITGQLYPVYQLLSQYLNVEFVPYGNAHINTSDDGTLNFTCQHGPNECYGNEIQACAVSVDSDSQDVMEFVNCAMFRADNSEDAILQLCAEESGIEWSAIQDCISSGQGDELFIQYGLETDAVQPHIAGTPSIAFNGVYDPDVSSLASQNFFEVACFLLEQPKECQVIYNVY